MEYANEYEELGRLHKESGLSMEEFVEEGLAPLQAKLTQSPDALVCAITRTYESHVHHTSLATKLHVGIVTPKTTFPPPEDLHGTFLQGVKNSCILDNAYFLPDEFLKQDNSFTCRQVHHLPLLYFGERPPQIEQTSSIRGCFGGGSFHFPIEEPRFELCVGDQEVLPVLQEQLHGWQYLKLATLLDRKLPLSDDLVKKIEQEQLTLFDEIGQIEKKVRALVEEKDKRLAVVKGTGGEIHCGTHIVLTDEFVEQLRYGPPIKEDRDKHVRLITTAVERNYHETGRTITRRVDVGVETTIDLKVFFSQRKALLEL